MRIFICYMWLGSLLAVAFYSHEFGYVEGQQYQKFVNNEKLQSCNKIIAGSMYE